VPTEEGERWAQEEGLLFVEASAKSGDNVEAAFEKAYVHTFDTQHT
jgi:Ras-related protein Rab-2A